jgi:hypothetical protein
MSLPMRFAVSLKTGCWEWCGELSSNGYGRVWRNNKRIAAHRAYYEQEVGPIPDGLQLDHLCRNRRCVNPDHLEPVTRTENQLRARPFAKKAHRKLTAEAVAFIRESNMTQDALAAKFGVSQSTISEARRGITWNEDSPLSHSERRELAKAAA